VIAPTTADEQPAHDRERNSDGLARPVHGLPPTMIVTADPSSRNTPVATTRFPNENQRPG